MVFEDADMAYLIICAFCKSLNDQFILFLNTKPAIYGPLIDKNGYLQPDEVIDLESANHSKIKTEMQEYFKTPKFKSARDAGKQLAIVFWTPITRNKEIYTDENGQQQEKDASWWFYDANGDQKHLDTFMSHISEERVNQMKHNMYIHINIKGLYSTTFTQGKHRVEEGHLNINRTIDGVDENCWIFKKW